MPDGSRGHEGRTERAALLAAAHALSETPWPTVEETPMAERMISVLFGTDSDDDGFTREAALEAYVSGLIGSPAGSFADPARRLVSDADTTLAAARMVAESGRVAATSINLNTDDILVLERAIGDIRFSRDMYLAALKRLEHAGHAMPAGRAAELKAAFSQTIRDVSATADLVAERAASPGGNSRLADGGAPAID